MLETKIHQPLFNRKSALQTER